MTFPDGGFHRTLDDTINGCYRTWIVTWLCSQDLDFGLVMVFLDGTLFHRM